MMDRFFTFLENMRNKPEHTRRNFAIGVSTGVTFVLLVIWGFFILPRSISTAAKGGSGTVVAIPTPDQTASQNTQGGGQDWQATWNQMQAKYGTNSNGTLQANTEATTNTNTSADTAQIPADDGIPVLPYDVNTPSYPNY